MPSIGNMWPIIYLHKNTTSLCRSAEREETSSPDADLRKIGTHPRIPQRLPIWQIARGLSKAGNRYLRRLLHLGAMAQISARRGGR